jgi:hypothetical protein
MDDNIALLLLASCRTRQIRAKWFRRVPGLCVCLHKRQYANGRLLFQAPLLFPPLSGVLCVAGRGLRIPNLVGKNLEEYSWIITLT